MESTIGDDVPTVPTEELIEDLSLGEDEGEEDTAHAGMVE
jgi:nonsense-mediated mRNA decay protein 3